MLFVAGICAFVCSRVVLQGLMTPYMDWDSYKYLLGAEAMWLGQELPPLFVDLVRIDGALHATPGYAWLIYAVWSLLGDASLRGILFVNSAVSLLGYLAGADLVRRWVGPVPGALVFLVLVTQPALAWWEHALMPDALATPVILITAWITNVLCGGTSSALRGFSGGAVVGVLTGANVLMRTASQAFTPLPILVATACTRGRAARAAWLVAFLLGYFAIQGPWLAHNYTEHGCLCLSASTGRSGYFSALWSNVIDRSERIGELGLKTPTWIPSAFEITERTLDQLVAGGKTVREADAAMWRDTMRAYRENTLREVVQGRVGVILGLFAARRNPETAAATMIPIREFGFYSQNQFYNAEPAGFIGNEYGRMPTILLDSMERARGDDARWDPMIRIWVSAFEFDGLPLLVLYLLAVPGVLLMPVHRWPAFWTMCAPPLLYIPIYAVFGAPLYRYQASLHPFFYLTIVLGVSALYRFPGRRWGPGLMSADSRPGPVSKPQ